MVTFQPGVLIKCVDVFILEDDELEESEVYRIEIMEAPNVNIFGLQYLDIITGNGHVRLCTYQLASYIIFFSSKKNIFVSLSSPPPNAYTVLSLTLLGKII